MIAYNDYAVATIISDSHFEQGHKFIESVVSHNKWLKHIVVFYSETLCQLSEDNRNKLSSISNHIEFNKVDESKYDKYISTGNASPAIFKVETFGLKQFEKVIYFDCDCIIISDIINAFLKNIAFGTSIGASDTNKVEKTILSNHFNSLKYSMMLITKMLLNQKNNALLVDYVNTQNAKHAERVALRKLLQNRYITMLSDIWCVDAGRFKYANSLGMNAKVIHYSGSKPWIKNEECFSYINKFYGSILPVVETAPKTVVENTIHSKSPQTQALLEKTREKTKSPAKFDSSEFEREYQEFIAMLKQNMNNENI